MIRVDNPTIFGRIFVAHEIEQAAMTTLATWMYTYLREIERQLQLPIGTIPDPTRYTNRNSFDATPGEDLNRIVVIGGPTSGDPLRDGGGGHTVTWRLGVGAAASHADEMQARFITSAIAAAARAILVQKKTLGGVADWTEFISEEPTDLPLRNELLQYRAVSLEFLVQVQNVVTGGVGPDDPDVPPDGAAYPIVEEVIIDLIKVPIGDGFT